MVREKSDESSVRNHYHLGQQEGDPRCVPGLLYLQGSTKQARRLLDQTVVLDVLPAVYVHRQHGQRGYLSPHRYLVVRVMQGSGQQDIPWEEVRRKPGVITTHLEDNSKKVVTKSEARTSLSDEVLPLMKET